MRGETRELCLPTGLPWNCFLLSVLGKRVADIQTLRLGVRGTPVDIREARSFLFPGPAPCHLAPGLETLPWQIGNHQLSSAWRSPWTGVRNVTLARGGRRLPRNQKACKSGCCSRPKMPRAPLATCPVQYCFPTTMGWARLAVFLTKMGEGKASEGFAPDRKG